MPDPRDATEVLFDGRLLSGARPVAIVVLMFTAVVLAIATGSAQLAFATVECSLVVIALRFLVPANPVWHGRARLGIGLDGISITRRGRRYTAAWDTFDEAHLDRLRRWVARQAEPWGWKLTLMNARKPAISAFIHADPAEAMFMFPVEFAFDAEPDEAQDLGDLIGRLVVPPPAVSPRAGS